VPDGARLFAELMDVMRLALATAIHDVFLLAAIVAIGGVVAAFFLPERPLRRRRDVPGLTAAGAELAADGAGVAPPVPAASEPRLFVATASDEGSDIGDGEERQPATVGASRRLT
jgi:hypothetical protein